MEITQTAMCNLLGINRTHLNNIIHDRSRPNSDFLSTFVDKLQFLNARWLLTGDEAMTREGYEVPKYNKKDVFNSPGIKEGDSTTERIDRIESVLEKILEKLGD